MKERVDQLLKEHGAILVRKRKHEIWRLPNGRNFVRASTSSDKNSEYNNYSDLRKTLGLTPEHSEGQRREKKVKNGREEVFHYTREINTGLADKLRLIGASESALKERIELLETQNALLAEEPGCWFCQLKDWWRTNVKGNI